jgi:FMN-dependent NADH-azoreductase
VTTLGPNRKIWFDEESNLSAPDMALRIHQASGYLRQVLGFIGITDLDIILAGRERAGLAGETAVEEFGDVVALAAAA